MQGTGAAHSFSYGNEVSQKGKLNLLMMFLQQERIAALVMEYENNHGGAMYGHPEGGNLAPLAVRRVAERRNSLTDHPLYLEAMEKYHHVEQQEEKVGAILWALNQVISLYHNPKRDPNGQKRWVMARLAISQINHTAWDSSSYGPRELAILHSITTRLSSNQMHVTLGLSEEFQFSKKIMISLHNMVEAHVVSNF